MEMVMLRNCTIRTTKGFTVRFEANKPKEVPEDIIEECMQRGAVPVDPNVSLPQHAVEAETEAHIERVTKPAPQGKARENAIVKAFESMIKRNERDDFTAGGLPDARKVSGLVGFNVQSKERNDVWLRYQESLNED